MCRLRGTGPLRQRTLPNTGALPYWKRDARGLTELIQLRALAILGLHSAAAVGPNRMLAAMACNLTPPDRRTVIDHSPDAVAAFLRPRPVRELPGVGSKVSATLASYGLHRVGDVADLPPATLQRLLGARAGRTLHERALGRDATIVDPAPTAASISTEHRFTRDELDPAAHRRALLALADDLGTQLRTSGQIAAGLTCTIRYADHTSTRRSRALPEATQHTVLLARTAYAVYESLGLQRARVRSISLRADALRPAEGATRQLAATRSRWRSKPSPTGPAPDTGGLSSTPRLSRPAHTSGGRYRHQPHDRPILGNLFHGRELMWRLLCLTMNGPGVDRKAGHGGVSCRGTAGLARSASSRDCFSSCRPSQSFPMTLRGFRSRSK
ncbi:hypothetical protein ACFQ51_42035 [Streptomyces kaempferi]